MHVWERASAREVVNGVCVLKRRAMLERVGLFDEALFMYGEDWDYAIRANRDGWASYHIDVGAIVHDQDERGYDFLSLTNFLLKRNALIVLLKHRKLLSALGALLGSGGLTAWRAVRASFSGVEGRSYREFAKRLFSAYVYVLSRGYLAPTSARGAIGRPRWSRASVKTPR